MTPDNRLDEIVEHIFHKGFTAGMDVANDNYKEFEAFNKDEDIQALTNFIREDIIGEDEIIPQSETRIDLGNITGIKPRNKLRAEQRAKLNQLGSKDV